MSVTDEVVSLSAVWSRGLAGGDRAEPSFPSGCIPRGWNERKGGSFEPPFLLLSRQRSLIAWEGHHIVVRRERAPVGRTQGDRRRHRDEEWRSRAPQSNAGATVSALPSFLIWSGRRRRSHPTSRSGISVSGRFRGRRDVRPSGESETRRPWRRQRRWSPPFPRRRRHHIPRSEGQDGSAGRVACGAEADLA